MPSDLQASREKPEDYAKKNEEEAEDDYLAPS